MEDHKLRALKDHYKAQISWASSEITSYLEYPSAVGEHTFLDTMEKDRKSTRLNSSHSQQSRMPSSA